MVRYPGLKYGIVFVCIRLLEFGSCNTLPADWRSRIHSSILTTLESQYTNASWSSRSDIIEDENPFGMRAAAQRTGQLFPYNYWPNNGKCIPFKLHPAFDADAETRQRILNALRTIERRTHSCLTFKMWSDEAEYIHVYPGRYCEADVGRTPGTATRVRLGRDCMKNGILLHELLHALGFFHEHNRPDRDHYLDVFPDHVESGKYDPNFIIMRNLSSHRILYDLESIMHYSPLAFAHDSNKPTMVPKVPLPAKMGQQEYLSALDVAKLKRAYGCIDDYFEPVPEAAPLTCSVEQYRTAPAPTTATSTTTITGFLGRGAMALTPLVLSGPCSVIVCPGYPPLHHNQTNPNPRLYDRYPQLTFQVTNAPPDFLLIFDLASNADVPGLGAPIGRGVGQNMNIYSPTVLSGDDMAVYISNMNSLSLSGMSAINTTGLYGAGNNGALPCDGNSTASVDTQTGVITGTCCQNLRFSVSPGSMDAYPAYTTGYKDVTVCYADPNTCTVL